MTQQICTWVYVEGCSTLYIQIDGQPAPFATCYMVGPKNKRTMIPTLKNNAASGYQGPVKIELLKGADLLQINIHFVSTSLSERNYINYVHPMVVSGMVRFKLFIATGQIASVHTVFTRISAAPEQAPPSIKRRTWSGMVNKRRPRISAAAPVRRLFEYFHKMIKIHCNNCNGVLSQQWEFIFINSDVLSSK